MHLLNNSNNVIKTWRDKSENDSRSRKHILLLLITYCTWFVFQGKRKNEKRKKDREKVCSIVIISLAFEKIVQTNTYTSKCLYIYI